MSNHVWTKKVWSIAPFSNHQYPLSNDRYRSKKFIFYVRRLLSFATGERKTNHTSWLSLLLYHRQWLRMWYKSPELFIFWQWEHTGKTWERQLRQLRFGFVSEERLEGSCLAGNNCNLNKAISFSVTLLFSRCAMQQLKFVVKNFLALWKHILINF